MNTTALNIYLIERKRLESEALIDRFLTPITISQNDYLSTSQRKDIAFRERRRREGREEGKKEKLTN